MSSFETPELPPVVLTDNIARTVQELMELGVSEDEAIVMADNLAKPDRPLTSEEISMNVVNQDLKGPRSS